MATSNTTDAELNVSAGAQAATRRALAALEPYAGEPRVKALIGKLTAIADPTNFDADRAAEIAKALADCEALAKSEDVSDLVKAKAERARVELEKSYLERMSPAGADVWKRAMQAQGRAVV